MSWKPQIICFYKNDEFLEELLNRNFSFRDPIKIRGMKRERIYEFEYYNLYCFQVETISPRFKGYKPSKVICEKIVYENSEEENIYSIEASLQINGIIGSFNIEIINRY